LTLPTKRGDRYLQRKRKNISKLLAERRIPLLRRKKERETHHISKQEKGERQTIFILRKIKLKTLTSQREEDKNFQGEETEILNLHE